VYGRARYEVPEWQQSRHRARPSTISKSGVFSPVNPEKIIYGTPFSRLTDGASMMFDEFPEVLTLRKMSLFPTFAWSYLAKICSNSKSLAIAVSIELSIVNASAGSGLLSLASLLTNSSAKCWEQQILRFLQYKVIRHCDRQSQGIPRQHLR
jgi:hypothetical protein